MPLNTTASMQHSNLSQAAEAKMQEERDQRRRWMEQEEVEEGRRRAQSQMKVATQATAVSSLPVRIISCRNFLIARISFIYEFPLTILSRSLVICCECLFIQFLQLQPSSPGRVPPSTTSPGRPAAGTISPGRVRTEMLTC